MGVFTLFDCICGNPVEIFNHDINEEEFESSYNWMNSVRVVLKDGSVIEPGTYDSYGKVMVNDKFYNVSDNSIGYEEHHEGLVILDKTYDIMIKNPEYPNFIKNHNLYEVISKRGWKHGIGTMGKYIECQTVCVVSEMKKDQVFCPVVDGYPESYEFLNPDICPENKERIDEFICLLIDDML